MKGSSNRGGTAGRIVVQEGGKLFFDGSDTDDLIFTSLLDDSVGSNINGTSSVPRAGGWRGIKAEAGSEVAMKGFSVFYADIALTLKDAVAHLKNVVFSNNTLDIKATGSSTILCTSCENLITDPVDLFK